MANNTPNYGIQKPVVGGSINLWGGIINTALDAFDSIVKAVSDSATAAQGTANTALTVANAASAYPDKVFQAPTTGTVPLTAAQQGYVVASVSGITFQLPSTAVDGVTFKFIGGQVAFSVTAPVGFVTTLPSTFIVQPNMQVTLLAINVTGFGLIWEVLIPKGASTWDSSTIYVIGEIVQYSGSYYVSTQSANTGNTPAVGSSQWFALTTYSTATYDPRQVLVCSAKFSPLAFIGTSPGNYISFQGTPYGVSTLYKVGAGKYTIGLVSTGTPNNPMFFQVGGAFAVVNMTNATQGFNSVDIEIKDLSGAYVDPQWIWFGMFEGY